MLLDAVDVTLQHTCPRTGRALRTVTLKKSSIAYCIDESDQKVLLVGRDKQQRELPVAGGVQMHTRFMSDGKVTLVILRRNITVFLSGALPEALADWCKALVSGRRTLPANSATAPLSAGEQLPKRPVSSPESLSRKALQPLTPENMNSPRLSDKKKARNPGR